MRTNNFDVDAAIKRLGDTEAEQAFATISIANRMARKLPAPQPDASLAALHEWLTDVNTKESEKVAPIPDELARRLSDTVLRLAAQEPRLVPTLAEAVAEQEQDDRAAVRETLARAVAVSLILTVATTGFHAHGENWEFSKSAMSDEVLRAVIDQLASWIVVK